MAFLAFPRCGHGTIDFFCLPLERYGTKSLCVNYLVFWFSTHNKIQLEPLIYWIYVEYTLPLYFNLYGIHCLYTSLFEFTWNTLPLYLSIWIYVKYTAFIPLYLNLRGIHCLYLCIWIYVEYTAFISLYLNLRGIHCLYISIFEFTWNTLPL